MSRFLSLAEAVESTIRDGDTVAMEGFTHLIPFAAGHEVIRQRRRHLTLIRMTPDLIYDQLIGMGCADKLIFSWVGNPGVGSLHRFRDAYENGWPGPIAIEEHSHAAMANAYEAGAAGLPLAVFRGYLGVDLPKVNRNIRHITCPFTGERLAAVPAIRPDVAVVHALKADRAGQDAALEPWPLDPAAEDVDHPSFAIGRRPEMPDVGELGVDGEDRCLRDHDRRSILAPLRRRPIC